MGRSRCTILPGTMLKRALTGRLALMKLVGEVQQELADPIKIDRRPLDGPLGRERKKCDYAKRAIAYSLDSLLNISLCAAALLTWMRLW